MLKELPDQSRPNVYIDVPLPYTVSGDDLVHIKEPCNGILHFQSSAYHVPVHASLLSVRCAFNGQRVYEVDGGRFAVDDNRYLILNTGQSFSSYIHSDAKVESFNVFFHPDFAAKVLRSLITSADRLLDEPNGKWEQPLAFFEKLYPYDDILSPVLFRMRDVALRQEVRRGWLEEQCHLLLERMLQVHRNVRTEIESLPAIRSSTRVELYHRLHRARDFMDASLNQPISLPQIAEVAWFSPHHFLRLFKEVFHETPHQYLTRKRLERAKYLLAKTDHTVTNICYEVGFESLGSFSWLFHRRLGVSPEMFRYRYGNGNAKRAISKKRLSRLVG